MTRTHHKRWNRELQHADWRKIVALLKMKVPVGEGPTYYTSKMCARCEYIYKDLRGQKLFKCPNYRLRIDRQLNACINIYLSMRGFSYSVAWVDRTIVGGFALNGAETRSSDELARSLHELMKPQVYVGALMPT